MLEDLNSRLAEAIQKKQLKKKLERDLQTVSNELQEQSARLEMQKERMDKEKVDIDHLEKTSLASLFHTVLGNREESLEKERQEFLSAQMKYQQTSHRVQYLKEDRDGMERKLASLRDIESIYTALLAEKEKVLLNEKPNAAAALISLSERIAFLVSENRELDEALAAGSRVLSGLDEVISSMQSAENWGTFDMLGGGILSTVVKHSRIDTARAQISAVQADIQRFHRELADVGGQVDLKLEISEFEYFADHFCDNLITDWVVQSKIEASLKGVQSARLEYEDALRKLKRHKKIVMEKLDALHSERQEIIEKTA